MNNDEPEYNLDPPDNTFVPQTLQQLQKGPNTAAATDQIEERVYTYATLFHFIALRLYTSSGTTNPALFNTETRQYVEENPKLNVRVNNQAPTFIRTSIQDTDIYDDRI